MGGWVVAVLPGGYGVGPGLLGGLVAGHAIHPLDRSHRRHAVHWPRTCSSATGSRRSLDGTVTACLWHAATMMPDNLAGGREGGIRIGADDLVPAVALASARSRSAALTIPHRPHGQRGHGASVGRNRARRQAPHSLAQRSVGAAATSASAASRSASARTCASRWPASGVGACGRDGGYLTLGTGRGTLRLGSVPARRGRGGQGGTRSYVSSEPGARHCASERDRPQGSGDLAASKSVWPPVGRATCASLTSASTAARRASASAVRAARMARTRGCSHQRASHPCRRVRRRVCSALRSASVRSALMPRPPARSGGRPRAARSARDARGRRLGPCARARRRSSLRRHARRWARGAVVAAWGRRPGA